MKHLWSQKRVGFTAVSAIFTIALCDLLVHMLAAVDTPLEVIIFVSVCVAIALGRLIHGLGEAGEKRDADHRHHLPQNWTRSVNPEPGCDLCPERETFLHCKSHGWSLCWSCGYRHNQNNPKCVLIPFGTPELVK